MFQLNDSEKKLFELVGRCDVGGVKSLIEHKRDKKVNINVADYRGITALCLAVKKNCVEMVKYFVSLKELVISDAAFQAIENDRMEIAILLLNRLKSKKLEFVGTDSTETLTPYLTPLIVAAQNGHYDMIDMLLKRGHTIDYSPNKSCSHFDCRLGKGIHDKLTKTDQRIAVFKALANPTYIIRTSNDPILTCFQLYDEVNCWSVTDIGCRKQYILIKEKINEFLCDLLGETRSSEEVLQILNKRGEMEFGGSRYPRLVHAMRIKAKKFVGHPHVQAVMLSEWLGKDASWQCSSVFWKVTYMFWRLIILPLMVVCYLTMPEREFSLWLIGAPYNRLIDSVAMYLVFLCLLFYQNNQSKNEMNLNFPQSGVEYLIILFTVSLIWNTIRHLISRGLSRMFTTPWLLWDIVTELFLTMMIMFWFLSWFSYNESKNVERKYWNYFEPALIAEAFLTWATVFAFMRLFLFFQLSRTYGRLLVHLYKMIKACFQYILLFAVLMIAFVAGLNRLYEYYRGMKYVDPITNEEMKQPNSFVSMQMTFLTLFWALFSMSESNCGDIIIKPDDEGKINKHYVTEMTGSVLFAAFEFIMVIVVLNMLIATLSDAYMSASKNIIQEWFYGKTEVYMDYMSSAYTLPVPYNLLVMPIVEIMQAPKTIINPKKKWRCSLWNGCYLEDVGKMDDEKYRKFMIQLTQRYYFKKFMAQK